MRYVRASVAAAIAAIVLSVPARAANDAASGETIAVEACSACHQVKASQSIPPPVPNPDERTQVSTPSFSDIATRGYDAAALRQLILNPPHPMREQHWREADLEAVVAYIESLRRETAP